MIRGDREDRARGVCAVHLDDNKRERVSRGDLRVALREQRIGCCSC